MPRLLAAIVLDAEMVLTDFQGFYQFIVGGGLSRLWEIVNKLLTAKLTGNRRITQPYWKDEDLPLQFLQRDP